MSKAVVISKGVEYLERYHDHILQVFSDEITRVGRIVVKGDGEEKFIHKEETVEVPVIERVRNRKRGRYIYENKLVYRDALGWFLITARTGGRNPKFGINASVSIKIS
jgi:hypothetical protein